MARERRRLGRLPDDRSPQTAASAAFHDQTATGKLNAVMTPIGPSGCHCSIMRWPGRSDAMRQAVELPRQADGEVADVDHLLHFAVALGADLAHLERDQIAERLLQLAQRLAEIAHQLAALRRRPFAPGAGTPAPPPSRPRRNSPALASSTAAIGSPVGGVERRQFVAVRIANPFRAGACAGVDFRDVQLLK